jgi:hypothetical protein
VPPSACSLATDGGGWKKSLTSPNSKSVRLVIMPTRTRRHEYGMHSSTRATPMHDRTLPVGAWAPLSATCEPLVAADHHCPLHAGAQARGVSRFDQKHKRAEPDAPAEPTTVPTPTARLHLGRKHSCAPAPIRHEDDDPYVAGAIVSASWSGQSKAVVRFDGAQIVRSAARLDLSSDALRERVGA